VFLNCVCCHSQVTGCRGMYWNVQWLRIADSAAWNWVCVSWNSHHSVETVPFTDMFGFVGVLGSGKYLPNESLANYIKIHSGIRCICKSMKSEYYLHHVCPLGMTRLPLGALSWIWGGEGGNLLRKFKFL